MTNTPSKRSALRKAYIRRLGNPYASLEIPENDFEIFNEQQRAYRERGNPYAKLSEAGAVEVVDTSSGSILDQPAEFPDSLSKVDFQKQCRDIFRSYIPHAEKGRLRAHHRYFITRNGSRSPKARARLVRELRRYDISTLEGVQAYFNRERELFTAEKLKQVERSVRDDD